MDVAIFNAFKTFKYTLFYMTKGEPPSQVQLRGKAWTAIITFGTIISLVLHDWDQSTGHTNVFSSIRPTLKYTLNRLYGVDSNKSTETPPPSSD